MSASTGPIGSDSIEVWFATRLPPDWSGHKLSVETDNDEILVVVDLGESRVPDDTVFGSGEKARLEWFREQTRDERMAVAAAAEAFFGRKVSWAARAGSTQVTFTTAAVPVMTRLRLRERRVLDTLIDAGVARSRSDALAWCVRLVADNETEWISDLRAAFSAVEAVRADGPASRRPGPSGPCQS